MGKALAFITLLFVFSIPSAVRAQTATHVTKDNYYACTTEAAFEELVDAVTHNDQRWAASIEGCIIMQKGLKAAIKKCHGLLCSKVEIYVWPPSGGRPIVLFTYSEAIQRR